MSTIEWSQVRTAAVDSFRGEAPGQQVEAEIIEQFTERPRVVLRAIEEIAESVAQGKVRSGWAVLRARLQGSEGLADVSVSVDDREERVATAERWLRLAGLHFDRESEVLDELFGDRGRLREWAADEALQARLASLWRELRPLGEQVEAEELERAAEHKATRERIEEAKQKKRAEVEAALSA